jgi:uncharacterized protein (TIGR03435 family)
VTKLLMASVLAGALGCAQVALSLAQSTTREFDAVSVKPIQQRTEGFRMRSRTTPLMLDFTAQSLSGYVLNAYGLKHGYQLVNKGPSWIDSDRYDILARTSEPATRDEMMLMLRKALAERFHLRVHAETREVTVLFLTVDRRGPKLKPATETSSEEIMLLPNSIAAPHQSMAAFAELLSDVITDRPVLDRTGLAGEYQIKMEFAADGDDPSSGPPIYAALTDQLGLKLVAGKAPIEVLVIDHADRPSVN